MPLVREVCFTELIERTNNFGRLTWLGKPIWQNVLDLWTIQETIYEIRPSLLIETGTNRGGSAYFYAQLFDLIGHGQVISVDVESLHDLTHPRVRFIVGDAVGSEVLSTITAAAAAIEGPVMVILDSDHRESHVAAELNAYHRFVTPGSVLLVQDGVIDTLPMYREARPGPLPALHKFCLQHPEFEIDEERSRRFIFTHHPSGWLRRTR